MKQTTVLFFALCSLSAQAQQYTKAEVDSFVNAAILASYTEVGLSIPKPDKYKPWHGVTVAGIGFTSGIAYGLHETSVHHPWNLPQGWNMQFWDNRISWTNKYKNGDPLKGAKFPGANTWFVATTDGKHLTGSAHRIGLFSGGMVIGCTFGRQRSWEYLLFDTILFAGSYLLGFHFTYTDPIWRTP
jgi:hypothetical protein